MGEIVTLDEERRERRYQATPSTRRSRAEVAALLRQIKAERVSDAR